MQKQEMLELAEIVSQAVVTALEKKGLLGNTTVVNNNVGKSEKTAYQKTEQLLYNYNGFQRIVAERKQEIADLRRFGVPQKSGSIVSYGGNSGGVNRTVLPEETVDAAIRNVEASVQGTVEAIALIDKCMDSLRNDPYYRILEMRYFEGRTQEDIALEYGVSQVTISNNKGRLVRELAMRLFPNQFIDEMMR